MAIALEPLHEIASQVVQQLHEKRHAPIPGAILKPAVTSAVASRGEEFDLKALGFSSFAEFVATIPGIALQRRPGSDFLVAPTSSSEVLAAFAEDKPPIRRDFWRAFVEFPTADTVRLYDSASDKIRAEPAGTSTEGILVDPIPLEVQLQWRREFAAEQTGEIRDALTTIVERQGRGAFNDFARYVRDNPTVFRVWNRYQQKQVADWVERWSRKHGLSDDLWRGVSRSSVHQPVTINRRAEIYNLLDQVPIEDLLQIKVPLEWLLKITQGK